MRGPCYRGVKEKEEISKVYKEVRVCLKGVCDSKINNLRRGEISVAPFVTVAHLGNYI